MTAPEARGLAEAAGEETEPAEAPASPAPGAALSRWLRDDRLSAGLRLLLGGLFLWAGVVKAGQVHTLADDIANYHLVPAALIPLCAAALPFVEIVAAAALLLGIWARGAALLCALLMVGFSGALLSAFARGIDLTCGCFGGAALADWTTVARDVALLAMACHVAAFDRGRFGLSRR